jgi:hypothetical protein
MSSTKSREKRKERRSAATYESKQAEKPSK